MTELEEILNILLDAEERAFYSYADLPSGREHDARKAIDQKIRAAVEEIVREIKIEESEGKE